MEKQSILVHKKKALYREQLRADVNGDTNVPWEFQNKGIS